MSANAINATGQITGEAGVGIEDHAFLLTPWAPGDLNGDGVVNGLDIALVASNWLRTGFNNADANGDGVVNGLDIALISANWLKTSPNGGAGSGSAVPEPSAIVLAALGGLAVLACRRRRGAKAV